MWFSPIIPSTNLDTVFTYNHTAVISYGITYHLLSIDILTKVSNLYMHNYIKSLTDII